MRSTRSTGRCRPAPYRLEPEVDVETPPGYPPRFSEPRMDKLYAANAEQLMAAGHVRRNDEHTAESMNIGTSPTSCRPFTRARRVTSGVGKGPVYSAAGRAGCTRRCDHRKSQECPDEQD